MSKTSTQHENTKVKARTKTESETKSELPLWIQALDAEQIDEDMARALRNRELLLPKEVRSPIQNVRVLRDAYLGLRLLHPNYTDLSGLNGWQALVRITARENSRARMRLKVRDLESKVQPDQQEWAREAAKTMFRDIRRYL